jgi:hypothetical protein
MKSEEKSEFRWRFFADDRVVSPPKSGETLLLDRNFLEAFKRATEQKWSRQSIDPTISGFQFQPGTRWNPGLSDDKIAEYEGALGVQFPYDFRAFLGHVNGTDLPTVNVFSSEGEPPRTSVGVYSYPRDLEIVKQRIEDVRDSRSEIVNDLREQGFEFPAEGGLVPIFGNRYVLCSSNRASCVVLSIVVHSTDAIVYGDSLERYLEREFLAGR